jgi:hypothetical protein
VVGLNHFLDEDLSLLALLVRSLLVTSQGIHANILSPASAWPVSRDTDPCWVQAIRAAVKQHS